MLNETSARVRPYAGRDDAFAAAMERVERAAKRAAEPRSEAPPFIGRHRSGTLKHRDGHTVTPGPLFPADELDALPLLD